ncbi:CD59 glycoprotein [Diceros bicornis minor]|uniref:CD59 glycoprotein n=1 Tax=Diceros bicornis minor TaxID=77932 RepID=A0A7J7EKG1_DICBM|nr:CD59 glycoprotein [Diceros bicornis minor]XP_058383160.1 CD59 glycoprotein [Diceros bicornis minor]KAF5916259.1 hypothetical protein HPG69_007340 [Diceros bicornis minor]
MGSKEGFVLLGLLLILAVLCRSGHSLQCYSCINPVKTCNNSITCSHNFDSCLLVKAEPGRYYHQCWRFEDCNFEYISNTLGEKQLKYQCCREDLCNKDGGMSASGRTALLLIPLLAAAWNLFL